MKQSKPYYVASGPVCGECPHKHRTVKAAAQCAADHRAAVRSLGGGAYSDRYAHLDSCQQVRTQGAPCTCRCEK